MGASRIPATKLLPGEQGRGGEQGAGDTRCHCQHQSEEAGVSRPRHHQFVQRRPETRDSHPDHTPQSRAQLEPSQRHSVFQEPALPALESRLSCELYSASYSRLVAHFVLCV